MEQRETIAVTTDAEQPSSEQTRVERLVQTLLAEVADLQSRADQHDSVRATLMVNFGMDRPRHPHGIVVGHECATHDALMSVLRQYREKLGSIKKAIEELLKFVQDADCQCFDEYGRKRNYADLEGVPCDCDRCELVKRHSAERRR